MMCQDINFKSKIWMKIFLFYIQDFFYNKVKVEL